MDNTGKSRAPARSARNLKRGEATRRVILDAARLEFASKGFSGGSMRAIARSIDTELANIQHHFRDKVSLWNAVLADVFDSQSAEAARIYALYKNGEPDIAIQAMITSIVHHAAGNPHFVALMSQARFDSASQHARGYQIELREGIDKVTVLIELAQQKGKFVPGRPTLLFYQLLGSALRIFTAAADAEAILGKSPTSPDILEEHLETCLSIFMPHMRGEIALPPPPAPQAIERQTAIATDGQTVPKPSLVYLIGQVEAVLTKKLTEALSEFDLTIAKMKAFVRIARGSKPSAARLARLLDVTPQSVMIIVRSLEAQGLIHKQESAAGRRRLLLEVTDHGRSVLTKLREIIAATEREAFAGLAPEDRDHLREVLVSILTDNRPLALSEWKPLIDLDGAPV